MSIGTSDGRTYEDEFQFIVDNPTRVESVDPFAVEDFNKDTVRPVTLDKEQTETVRLALDPMPNIPSPPIVPKEWPPHPINPTRMSDETPDEIKAGSQYATMLTQGVQDPLGAEIERLAGAPRGRGGYDQLSRYRQNPIEAIGVKAYKEEIKETVAGNLDRSMRSVTRSAERLKEAAAAEAPIEKVKGHSFSLSRREDKFGHSFDIRDKEGVPKAVVHISELKGGKELHVEWIGSDFKASSGKWVSPNELGPKAMRDVIRELKREFPDAEFISGHRVSGVRGGEHGKGSANAIVRIRPPRHEEEILHLE